MALPIAAGLEIPDQELSVSFMRASGPGGQNVNKVATAVELRYHLERSCVLSEPVKLRLRALSGRRLNAEGTIVGYFTDSTNVLHGFVRNRQGRITKFTFPGGGTGFFQGTVLANINAVGDIAGYYIDANNVTHGLLGVRTSPEILKDEGPIPEDVGMSECEHR